MIQENEANSYRAGHIFYQKPALRLLVVGLLILTAFVIRLHNISKPPLDFQPVRQYMLVHNTRALYYDSLESIPEWKKQMATINKKRMGFDIEAPLLDHAVVFGYHMIGGEKIWMPRVLSVVFWMVGGVFIFLISEKIFSLGAALFSLVFYLFLPFGISASRSFQPDPLMIMLLLFSLFMILKFYDKTSLLRLAGVTVVSSMAMMIKPYCIFLIFGAFIAIAIHKEGVRKLFTNRDLYVFIFLSPLPGAAYYLSGLLTSGSYLQEHTSVTFLPHLLLEPYFWKDWLAMVLRVIGLISLAGALTGIFVIRNRMSRDLIIGLWAGYIVYGLLFAFHMHTHDYYQLPLIPIVALSLGPIGATVISRLAASKKGLFVLLSALLILAAGISFNTGKVKQGGHDRYIRNFGYVTGVNPQFYQFIAGEFENVLKVAKEVGEIVNHSTETLILSEDWGRSLSYHGELSGLPWPISTSFEVRKDRKISNPKGDDLYNSRYFSVRTHGKFIQYTPDYFIILDFEEFEKQPDLRKFLTSNYPVLAQSEDYLIFDTRKMAELNKQYLDRT